MAAKRDSYREMFVELETKMEEASALAETLTGVVDDPGFEYADIGAANDHCCDDMCLSLISYANIVAGFAYFLKKEHGLG